MWYTQFKWNLVSELNNMLNFSAMTLGNHEFDDRLEGLIPFLEAQNCPVVVTNMNISRVPQLGGLFRPSVVLEVGSRRVGIVGYLTPSTMWTSHPPVGLVIDDEIEAIAKEVEKLHNDGVDIIIALGHSGYSKDIEIAQKVPHVDIVVGAHTHDFLFTESPGKKNPSNNNIKGPYPTVVKNIVGHDALVVQAFAFTKYLGHIRVMFDDSGVVQNWLGMPILLDNTIEEDETIAQALHPWKDQLNALIKKIIGVTNVDLMKDRDKENTIGSFANEAMIWSYRNNLNKNGSEYKLAVLNSGSLRANILSGNITLEDLMTILPFEGTFDSLQLSGKSLKDTFEHSVAKFDSDGRNNAGQFLQVSGFNLIFDLRMPVGQRLISAKVLCDADHKEIEDDVYYDILTNSYIAGGGDGYKCISENKINHQIGPLDTDVIKDYLESNSPIHPTVKENIIFKRKKPEGKDHKCEMFQMWNQI